mmetsp:Transcript_87979/g.139794  ORF Transcript_87979/g.139794 Transcript_87979/m.139794 type:complete len:320 (-) Transcript_87979:270-1229(-)
MRTLQRWLRFQGECTVLLGPKSCEVGAFLPGAFALWWDCHDFRHRLQPFRLQCPGASCKSLYRGGRPSASAALWHLGHALPHRASGALHVASTSFKFDRAGGPPTGLPKKSALADWGVHAQLCLFGLLLYRFAAAAPTPSPHRPSTVHGFDGDEPAGASTVLAGSSCAADVLPVPHHGVAVGYRALRGGENQGLPRDPRGDLRHGPALLRRGGCRRPVALWHQGLGQRPAGLYQRPLDGGSTADFGAHECGQVGNRGHYLAGGPGVLGALQPCAKKAAQLPGSAADRLRGPGTGRAGGLCHSFANGCAIFAGLHCGCPL